MFLVSQPKLRRISMKPVQSSKTMKEDATKSATYQQFLKTMEHELRRLEETEQPITIGMFHLILFTKICICYNIQFFLFVYR